ncbi:MAG TPA: phenylalanine--tRNA ligase subunit beta [Ignavibacteria bacterium]
MKVSFNWLKNYIDLSITPQEIEEKLTMSGLEVESIEEIGKDLKDFIIAEVKEVEKHPNADKLTVCKVFDGNIIHQIICGAPNVAAGQKVVLGLAGATVPRNAHSPQGEPFKLSKVKIRGVESNGMICSEYELGLGENHEGILVLKDDAPVGKKFLEYLNIEDVVFEIGITPNRPDALSHIGVARELSAILDIPYKLPEISISEDSESAYNFIGIEIKDIDACPRYVARVIKDVKIAPSPEWLQKYLKAVGLRPINNVVDITNFVLYELGHPLHAFDYDKISGKKIIVRTANEGETFITLDGKEHKLNNDTLLICDTEKGIAIAGVMGGENSEISDQTVNVVLESAYFKPQSIRKTSKLLGLSTDASYRFERGADYDIQVFAVNRAAQLIQKIAGGRILKGIIDIYPKLISNRIINLRIDRLNFVLGSSISKDECVRILSRLGVKIISDKGNVVECEVPSFRPDLEREIDLIEEVARIYGYNRIEDQLNSTINYSTTPPKQEIESEIRLALYSLGFNEILTNSLLERKEAEVFSDKLVSILNPISQTMNTMRPSLIPGALQIIKRNINIGENNLRLFEIGNIFEKIGSGDKLEDYYERKSLMLCITGDAELQNWNQKNRSVDFYDLKGELESLFSKLRIDDYRFEIVKENEFVLNIIHGKKIIGSIQKVDKEILKLYDLEQDVFISEIDIESLDSIPKRIKKYIPPSKFPVVKRDIAFVLDENINVQKIEELIRKSSKISLGKVELFDIYSGGKLGAGKKNVAFSLEFVSKDNNLTSEEVDSEIKAITKELENKFNAQLRQF